MVLANESVGSILKKKRFKILFSLFIKTDSFELLRVFYVGEFQGS